MNRALSNPYKLNLQRLGYNPLFRDPLGNVWWQELKVRTQRYATSTTNKVTVRISIIRRSHGRYGPLVISRSSKLGFIEPGDTIEIDEVTSDPELSFLDCYRLGDEFNREATSGNEKVNLICCDGTQFSVKKSLLLQIECYRSMLDGQFREASRNEIKMQEQASTVAAFVKYLEEGIIDCGLGDLVQLGKMAHMQMMPALIKRIELEICARFDQNDPEENWEDAFDLARLLKSDWIALAYVNRIQQPSD